MNELKYEAKDPIIKAKIEDALQKSKITILQSKVYNFITNIPEGFVMSYKDVGLHINCKSSRAVGQALRKNPFAPEVPCHRVISTDKSIGGFSGSILINSPNLKKKRSLLEKEGVFFVEKKGKLYLENDEKLIHKLPKLN